MIYKIRANGNAFNHIKIRCNGLINILKIWFNSPPNPDVQYIQYHNFLSVWIYFLYQNFFAPQDIIVPVNNKHGPHTCHLDICIIHRCTQLTYSGLSKRTFPNTIAFWFESKSSLFLKLDDNKPALAQVIIGHQTGTHPYPNFNGGLVTVVEVYTWMTNYLSWWLTFSLRNVCVTRP